MLPSHFPPLWWHQTLFGYVPEHFKWSCHIRQNISGYGVTHTKILGYSFDRNSLYKPIFITYSRYKNDLWDINQNFSNYLIRFTECQYRTNTLKREKSGHLCQ